MVEHCTRPIWNFLVERSIVPDDGGHWWVGICLQHRFVVKTRDKAELPALIVDTVDKLIKAHADNGVDILDPENCSKSDPKVWFEFFKGAESLSFLL